MICEFLQKKIEHSKSFKGINVSFMGTLSEEKQLYVRSIELSGGGITIAANANILVTGALKRLHDPKATILSLKEKYPQLQIISEAELSALLLNCPIAKGMIENEADYKKSRSKGIEIFY